MAKKKWFKEAEEGDAKIVLPEGASIEVPSEPACEKVSEKSECKQASDLKKHPKFAKFKNEESI